MLYLRLKLTELRATFASLDEVSRVKVIKLISLLPCALNGHLVMQGVYKASIMDATCFTCDDSGHTRQALIVPEIDLASVEEAILILETLTEIPQFKESPRLRTKGMLALRRFIEHIRTPRLLDIEISPLGQWCVRSLRSSVRELRISARYVSALSDQLCPLTVSQSDHRTHLSS